MMVVSTKVSPGAKATAARPRLAGAALHLIVGANEQTLCWAGLVSYGMLY
jgi:hypothetical protein